MPKTVALLLPCLVDQYQPRVAAAVVRVLRRFDCEVTVPPGQTCCGLPFFDDGNEKTAAVLARQLVGRFCRFDYIVTPGYACCGMVRAHYPDLIADDQAVWTVHGRTYEFAEFLDVVLKIQFDKLVAPRPVTVALQPACSARRVDGGASMAKLLRQMKNVTVAKPIPGNTCCGFGGPFAGRLPSLSQAIADDRAKSLNGSVVCGEPGCSLTLAGSCERTGTPARVLHPAELIAEALGIDLDTLGS
jgi:L-lactate dehydrogenase complex protein LldE